MTEVGGISIKVSLDAQGASQRLERELGEVYRKVGRSQRAFGEQYAKSEAERQAKIQAALAREETQRLARTQRIQEKALREGSSERSRIVRQAVEEEKRRRLAAIDVFYREELRAVRRILKAKLDANDLSADDYRRQMLEAERAIEGARRRARLEARQQRRADASATATPSAGRGGSLGSRLGDVFNISAGTLIADAVQRIAFELREASVAAYELGTAVNETQNAFEEVFRDSAEAVDQFTGSYANLAGQTQTEARGILTQFGAIGRGIGLAGAELEAFATDAFTVAADLQSLFNLDGGEAFDRLRSALSGSSEVLDQFGINIREGALEQERLRIATELSIDAESERAKVLARLGKIVKDSTSIGAAGDLLRTQEETANQARRLSAEFREQREVLAQGLLPTYRLLIDTASDFLEANEAGLGRFAELLATGVFDAVALLTELGAALGEAGQSLGDVASTFGVLAGEATTFGEIDLLEPFRLIIEEVRGVQEALQTAAIAVSDFAAAFNDFNADAQDLVGLDELAAKNREQADAWREQAGALRESRTETEKERASRADRIKALRAEVAAMFDGLTGLQSSVAARRAEREVLEETAEALKKEASAREQLARLEENLRDRQRSEENGAARYAKELDALADLGEAYPDLIAQVSRVAQGYYALADAQREAEAAGEAQEAFERMSRLAEQLDAARRRLTGLEQDEAVRAMADGYQKRLALIEKEERRRVEAADRAYQAERERLDALLEYEKGRRDRGETDEAAFGQQEAEVLTQIATLDAELQAERKAAALDRVAATRQAEAELARETEDYARRLQELGEREAEALGQSPLETLRARESALQAELALVEGNVDAQKRLYLELRDTQIEIMEEQLQRAERFAGAVAGLLVDAFRSATDDPELSDTDIALQNLDFEERNETLRKGLHDGELAYEEYNLRVRKLTEDRAAFQKRVESDQAGFIERAAKKVTDFVIEEGTRQLTAFLAQQAAQLIFAQTSAAAAAAATSAAMQTIAASAGAAAGAVSIASFGAAAASGTAAALSGIAAVQAATIAASRIPGFEEGGSPEVELSRRPASRTSTGRGNSARSAGLPSSVAQGYVSGPGPRGRDSLLALLAPGEFVYPDETVQGRPRVHYMLMEAIKKKRISLDDLEAWLLEMGAGSLSFASRLGLSAHAMRPSGSSSALRRLSRQQVDLAELLGFPAYAQGGFAQAALLTTPPRPAGTSDGITREQAAALLDEMGQQRQETELLRKEMARYAQRPTPVVVDRRKARDIMQAAEEQKRTVSPKRDAPR